jgi:hypothetical protein
MAGTTTATLGARKRDLSAVTDAILPSEYVGVLVRGSTIVLVVDVTVGMVRVFV